MPGFEPVEADDAEVAEDVIAASNGDVVDGEASPELDVAAVKAGDDEGQDKA